MQWVSSNSHNETIETIGPLLSLTEYAVLGVLAEAPAHGFALSRDLGPNGFAGRILTVRRPLVYRALDRLVAEGLAAPKRTEAGVAGPQRVIHRITPKGKRTLRRWLDEPVEHVREIRIAFQLKLALLERLRLSPLVLLEAQAQALGSTLAALDSPDASRSDHLELWRRYNAKAAASYLNDLKSLYV